MAASSTGKRKHDWHDRGTKHRLIEALMARDFSYRRARKYVDVFFKSLIAGLAREGTVPFPAGWLHVAANPWPHRVIRSGKEIILHRQPHTVIFSESSIRPTAPRLKRLYRFWGPFCPNPKCKVFQPIFARNSRGQRRKFHNDDYFPLALKCKCGQMIIVTTVADGRWQDFNRRQKRTARRVDSYWVGEYRPFSKDLYQIQRGPTALYASLRPPVYRRVPQRSR